MLEQLIKKKNNVDLSKMPQRYPLYLGLDNLKKRIKDSGGTHSELPKKIVSLMNEINSGNDSGVIRKTRILLNYMENLEKFCLDFDEIEASLEIIQEK
ncbi:MAG: hypothetical protein KAQ64_01240 [Candidatus Pacebacteria bacterium]|nr:hypothetical protein [Candidatus Paceibacterota bacterium]